MPLPLDIPIYSSRSGESAQARLHYLVDQIGRAHV